MLCHRISSESKGEVNQRKSSCNLSESGIPAVLTHVRQDIDVLPRLESYTNFTPPAAGRHTLSHRPSFLSTTVAFSIRFPVLLTPWLTHGTSIFQYLHDHDSPHILYLLVHVADNAIRLPRDGQLE